MTLISRISLVNLALFKFNKNVLKSQASAHIDLLFNKNTFLKNNESRLINRFISSKPKVVKINDKRNFLASKFSKIDLPTEKFSHVSQGLLAATVTKLSYVYHSNKQYSYFRKEVNYFTTSEEFKKFCEILEKELPKFTPPNLIILLQLPHFNVSPNSILMKKIFTLILDNLNWFSGIDLLELYQQLNEKPFNSVKECITILKACEMYFETCLESDLSHIYDTKELTDLMGASNLPVKVKQLIAEKILDDIETGKYKLPNIHKFFEHAFKEPYLSIFKTELLEKLRLILHQNQSGRIYSLFSYIYKNAVLESNSLYDKDICDIFISSDLITENTDLIFIQILKNLCCVGYFNKEAIEKLIDLILSKNLNFFSPHIILDMASALTRVSAHEMNNPHWSKIIGAFESYNAMKMFSEPSKLIKFCEYITYLGCNTTNLLNNIFKEVQENKFIESNFEFHSLLQLYNYCKRCFPDSNMEVSEKSLNNLLQKSIYNKDFFISASIDKFFGSKNYVLYNCSTSGFNLLPIVAILGPDNKPMDLSSYQKLCLSSDLIHLFKADFNIDQVKRPPGSKVIVFFRYPDLQPLQFQNAPLMSGYYRLFSKFNENINADFVLLTQKYFQLDPESKKNYLNSEINKIIEN